MMRQEYFPTDIGNQIIWLHNFKDNIGDYATTVGVTPTLLAALLLDCDNALYALQSYRSLLTTFHDAAFKAIENALDKDTPATPIVWPSFNPPAPPTAVNNGALRRIFKVINDTIKKSPNYTNVIGADLRLIAAPTPPPNPTISPVFTLRATSGQKVEVVWTKGVFDGVKLEFDLGSAGTRSDTDLRPNYTLNWVPAPGTTAQIKVRLLYIYKGEEFGNWSEWKDWTLTG